MALTLIFLGGIACFATGHWILGLVCIFTVSASI